MLLEGTMDLIIIISSILSAAFLIVRINERGVIKNEYWSSSEAHFILVQF